jgi:hypothetical protein
MKAKDKEKLQNAVECEGFDYAFKYYSQFKEVKDEEFHRLRTEYVAARDKLAEYIGMAD